MLCMWGYVMEQWTENWWKSSKERSLTLGTWYCSLVLASDSESPVCVYNIRMWYTSVACKEPGCWRYQLYGSHTPRHVQYVDPFTCSTEIRIPVQCIGTRNRRERGECVWSRVNLKKKSGYICKGSAIVCRICTRKYGSDTGTTDSSVSCTRTYVRPDKPAILRKLFQVD